MITGHGSIESAVNCMRAGAFDYVIKPFSINQIDVVLKKAESFSQLVKVNQFLNQESVNATELIGDGLAMEELRKLIHRVAPTEATVLISGENGTGKELVANELFRTSARSRQPFIRVNCAAISEALIESEFFGHEKGAFTGALQRREGRFELANNGTILLDEISEISLKVQAKLLRVLQEREFERVGGNKTIKVNVRVVATTNRDLHSLVERGEFRQDLYYRLNVFPIHVPPLRDMDEDIPLLAGTFLERFLEKPWHPGQGYPGKRDPGPDRAQLARQCPRTSKHDRTGGHPDRTGAPDGRICLSGFCCPRVQDRLREFTHPRSVPPVCRPGCRWVVVFRAPPVPGSPIR